MKEYIKKFVNAAAADNYVITYIPFITSVDEIHVQNLVCNKTGKHLENDNGTVIICPPDVELEMVDLGLSVKWTKHNIGATCGDTTESWYGGYYAWGETETKSNYDWSTYNKHTNGIYSSSNKKVFTKYVPANKSEYWNGEGQPDNKLVLDPVDDIVNVKLGGNYRMPTKEEIEELIALSNQWVTDYNGISGLNGRVFTGKNGNTLFIPAAGVLYGSTHYRTGSDCTLWSSSLRSDLPSDARNLNFDSGGIYLDARNRYFGFSVRAVKA